MTTSVGARVQGWAFTDQALVLGALAQERGDCRTFSPTDVVDLFAELALPAPAKPSNVLAALQRRGDLTRGRARGSWQVTPAGRVRVAGLISDMEVAALLAEATSSHAPTLGHAQHAVVSPVFAPPGLTGPLGRFLAEHPFDTNVFGMTRFPDEADDDHGVDPVDPALAVARHVCSLHGLQFHLASDRAMDDDLWTNVAAHMWASRYGVAFFEDRRGRGTNYNLTIEVGSMLMAGRRTALLKDHTIDRLPTDLVGRIYKPIDLDDPGTVSEALHSWIRDDLGLSACRECG